MVLTDKTTTKNIKHSGTGNKKHHIRGNGKQLSKVGNWVIEFTCKQVSGSKIITQPLEVKLDVFAVFL